METRANWLMVTVVVGLLFVATIAFSLWLGLEGSTEGPTYEIHFEQSVAGLTKGSKVDLLGVPVGRVTQIQIEPANPRAARPDGRPAPEIPHWPCPREA